MWGKLPKGFIIEETRDTLLEQRIINSFMKITANLGCIFLKTPILGFVETFTKGINTTGSKTFQFRDKKGRMLLLAPDSTPQIIQWYLTTYIRKNPIRVFFQSPVFRYRNFKRRNWTQYGLCSVNDDPNTLDIFLSRSMIEILDAYINVIKDDLELPVLLRLNDFSIHRTLLRHSGVSWIQTDDILNKIRNQKYETILGLLETAPLTEETRVSLKTLLNFGHLFFNKETYELLLNTQGLYSVKNEISRLFLLARYIKIKHGIESFIDFSDLHSSELINGIAIRFMIPGTEKHYADGGDYTYYGAKISTSIKSFYSFAGGLRHAYRIVDEAQQINEKSILVLFRNKSFRLAKKMGSCLRVKGFNVLIVEQQDAFKEYMTIYPQYKNYLIVEAKENIRLYNTTNRKTTLITMTSMSALDDIAEKIAELLILFVKR